MEPDEPVILSATRTPIGNFLGSLSDVEATELGTIATREALERSGVDPSQVGEVIIGNVLSAGLGQAPARQVQLGADIPPETGALTINKVCGSGLKAAVLGAQAIKLKDHDCVVVGGMESMSNSPYLLPDAREGTGFGHGDLVDSMIHDGLWDVYNDYHMGNTAEVVAEEFDISREDQDTFALKSHEKAIKAWEEGWFDREVVAVEKETRKGTEVVRKDERPRSDSSLEDMAKLPPVFQSDGTVTAANSSGLSDGASSLVLASARFAEQHDLDPLARITGYATGGVDPEHVMLAPLNTIEQHKEKTGLTISDFDLVEINEAFSSQGCIMLEELDLTEDTMNIHGGAVALGHPIGCTGARILTTLTNALEQHDRETGLATLCLGGGNGVSVSIERIQ